MTEFEKGILKYLDKDIYAYLKKIKLVFLGTGGLGSNSAVNLARCGFTNFVLVDYDKVEASNLNRQFYFISQIGMYKTHALKENLIQINPCIEVEIINKKIKSKEDLKMFEDCHCIMEGFDDSRYKKITAEFFMKKDNLLVSASGIAGFGKSDEIKIRKISNTFFMVGDMKTKADEKTPPFSPCVSIAASKQADIVFDYFCKKAGFYL